MHREDVLICIEYWRNDEGVMIYNENVICIEYSPS